jgi:flagellar hook-length control protein FliK
VSPNGETKSTIIEILTTALIPDNEPAVLLAEGEKTNPNSDNSAKTTPEQLSKEFSKPQPLVELANTDMSTDESLSFGVSTEKPGRVGPSRENDTESITGRRVSTTVGMNDQVDSQSISSSLNTGEVRESSEILLTHPPVGGAEKTTGDEEKNLRPQGEGSVVELASKPQSKPLTVHALAALSYATPREGPRTVTTELVVDHQVSSPEFAQEVLARAAKELSLLVNDKSSEVRFTLKPESLGELILSIRMEGGKMSAQVDVSNPMVKAALEANIQQLRSDLAVRGIEVQTIEISSAAQSSPRESSGQTPHKSKSQSRRRSETDSVESYRSARTLGYNTVEFII